MPNFINLDSISPTYLCTAFTPVAPKRIRIQSSCQYLFTLLGSTGAKAALIMLMKLTPDYARCLYSRKKFLIHNGIVIGTVSITRPPLAVLTDKETLVSGNAHSFIKVRGSITVLSTSWKTGLDMAVVDKNKNFLYNPVRPAFWEVDGTWSFPLLL